MSSQINTTSEANQTVKAFISLGSNLPSDFGSPEVTLRLAIERISALSVGEVSISSVYTTEPVDCPGDTPFFLNAAMAVVRLSSRSAQDFLLELLAIEAEFGRERREQKNQPRCLDLDLITYGNQQVEDELLILPHPRAHQRQFVLQPIAEIEPDLVLPGQTRTVTELLASLS